MHPNFLLGAWLREGLKVPQLQHGDTKDIREKKRSRFSMWCQGAVGHRSRDVRALKEHKPLAPSMFLRQVSPMPPLWLSWSRTHTCSPQGRAPIGPLLLGVNRCRRPLGAGIQCQTAPSPPPPVHLIHLPVMRKKRPVSSQGCLSTALPTRPRLRKNPWAWSLLPVFLAQRQRRRSEKRAASSGLGSP